MWTDDQASATLASASAEGPRAGVWAWLAWASENATASTLAAPAPIRTAFAAARAASSARAILAVAAESAPATLAHTQTNASDATSVAHNAATDQEVPAPSAIPAATRPPAAPTITRLGPIPLGHTPGCVPGTGAGSPPADLQVVHYPLHPCVAPSFVPEHPSRAPNRDRPLAASQERSAGTADASASGGPSITESSRRHRSAPPAPVVRRRLPVRNAEPAGLRRTVTPMPLVSRITAVRGPALRALARKRGCRSPQAHRGAAGGA